MKKTLSALFLALLLLTGLANAQIPWVYPLYPFMDTVTFDKDLKLKELSAAPSHSSGYGKLYVLSSDGDIYFKDDAGNVTNLTTAGGVTTFVGLTDTPANYTGEGLKGVRVNVGESALEFYTTAGATDEKVGVDSGATAGYIGVAAGDGVLRTDATIAWTDGGNFVTLVVSEANVDHDALNNFTANEHYLQSAITEVGTVATGVWQGTDINATYVGNLPASKITSGALVHERGGLEADVNAYNGLVKISGGSTSAITDSSTDWDAGYTHVSNDGTDHGHIDQDVQTTSSPTFAGLTVGSSTGVVHVGTGTLAVEAQLAVTRGGTGVGTLGDGFILLGSGTGAVTPLDVTAKGSIVAGDGTTDPQALAVGTNDYVLTADSGETLGVKWAAAPGGGDMLKSVYDIGENNIVDEAESGDTATAFFDAGTVEHEYGGLEADVSAYAGLVKITGGTTSAVTIGIADDNQLEVDDADAANTDYARFTANGLQGRDATEVKTDLGLVIGTDVLAEQTVGITDDDLLEVDDADAASTDYARFTANGLQGRDATEVKTDLGLVIGTDVLAEQSIGIADNDLLEVDHASPADNDYAKFTANGLEGRSYAEVKTDLSLGNVEDTAISTYKLDDLAATDDNTDLDASTSKHGLMEKLGGGTSNFYRADGAWATPSGGGDFTGPGSSTDNALVRFHETTGKTGQNSAVTVADSGEVTITMNSETVKFGHDGVNATITISTGGLEIDSDDPAAVTYIDLFDDDTHRARIQAQEMASNITFTLPATAGTGVIYSTTGTFSFKTLGIANTNIVPVTDAGVADNEYAKFTATGFEGRTYAQVKTDLSLNSVENTALSTWAGTENITTVGTIATGTWNGTAVDIGDYTNLAVDANELTLTGDSLGLADHATARTAIGLAIDSDVLAYDAGLSDLAGVAMQADRFYYTSSDNTHVAGTVTAAGRALIDDAAASNQRTTLGLVIGTNVLAEQTIGIADDNLLEVDQITTGAASGEYARFTANGLESRSEAEFKADFNLEIGTDVQVYSLNTDTDDTDDLTTTTSWLGDLGGTGTAPTVDNDSHDHTSTTISGVDVSADTNLAVTANELTLTDDTLGLADHATARTALGLAIGTDVLAEQTIGIADNNLLEVDQVSPADDDYAKFTANGLEGRSYSEVRTDLGLVIGTNVLAEQTIGIGDDNLVEIDGADIADDEFARFTAAGLESRTPAEVMTDLPAASTTAPGKSELATIAEVNAGVDTTRAVTVDALAGSTIGRKTMVWKLTANDEVIVDQDDYDSILVPADFAGWLITGVAARIVTADDGAEDMDVGIYNITQTAEILSTLMQIEATEWSTLTSAQPGVIDTGEDDVTAGDIIRIDVDYAGDNCTGLEVHITFERVT